MNTELLLKVKEQILKESRQFDMHSWFTTHSPTNEPIPNCGTAACIGGWAIALSANLKLSEADSKFQELPRPRTLLELNYDQGHRLFFTSDWPSKMAKDYEIAYDTSNFAIAAKIAAERIDLFIATKGEQ